MHNAAILACQMLMEDIYPATSGSVRFIDLHHCKLITLITFLMSLVFLNRGAFHIRCSNRLNNKTNRINRSYIYRTHVLDSSS